MVNVQEETQKPFARRSVIRDDWAYMLPMAVFLLLIWVGTLRPWLYPVSYVARSLICAALLALLWKQYTKIRWSHFALAVAVGVLGLIQWVGMEKLLLHAFAAASAHGVPLGWVFVYGKPPSDSFDPFAYFTTPAVLWSFIAIRWASASLMVPVMEELFWRDFVWRTVLAPNDFKMAAVGEWDWKAFLVVAALCASVHIQWITAFVWALMIGWLLIKTKSLGACIIAHGVTNFLLGAYVLYTKDWYFW